MAIHGHLKRLPPQAWWLLACLACAVGIRLIKITQPFVDAWSWRQADVAMIAENFYRHGFQLLYPQINWAGPAPGYVGTEFPLVPFIAALLYGVFGVEEWVGRAVSLLFFALSVPLLYLLVDKISTTSSALWAVGMYSLAPLSIFAGRAFMPDMASLSCSIAALYLFALWLERAPHAPLFLAMSLATSLAILIKLPAILIGVPMLAMAWERYGVRRLLRRELVAFAVLALSVPAAWYVHAYRISLTYEPYHFFGSGGLGIEGVDWYVGLLQRTAISGLTVIVSGAMLIGLWLPARRRFGRLFHWWLLAMIVFMVLAGMGHRHDWYQLPIVPGAAVLAGQACDAGWHRLARLAGTTPARLCAAVLVAGLAYLAYINIAPHYEPKRLGLWQVGRELNRTTPLDALVVIADDGDPTGIYYSRRQGWHLLPDFGSYPVDSQHAIQELEQLRTAGASHLSFVRNSFWWFKTYPAFRAHLESRYRGVRQTEAYVIFDIKHVRGGISGESSEGLPD